MFFVPSEFVHYAAPITVANINTVSLFSGNYARQRTHSIRAHVLHLALFFFLSSSFFFFLPRTFLPEGVCLRF